MSTIAIPSAFVPTSFQFDQWTNQRVRGSVFGGSEQATDLLNDRWMATIDTGWCTYTDGQKLEAFRNAMRGQVNVCALPYYPRTAPTGTARGTMTLNASAAQGASSIVITGVSPSTGTLLAGDVLGVGGLLLMVSTDCTAVAGVITVPLTNRLRIALSSGASVTWNAPTALFRLLNSSGIQYVAERTSPASWQFGEKIA